MPHLPLLVILCLLRPSIQELDNRVDDSNPFEEAKAAILKEQNLQNLGGIISNFMQSEGAKHLGEVIANAASGEKAGDLLQGLQGLLGGGGGKGRGFDPSLLGAALNMLGGAAKQSSSNEEGGLDLEGVINLMSAFSDQGKGKQNFMSLMPMIAQTINAFTGPEAHAREEGHKGHGELMPPLLERFHIAVDHFVNSEMGQVILNYLGGEKVMKMFADGEGKINYDKFVDMLENHSFRKYWISMMTEKIAKFVSFFSNPRVQKKYMTTFQHFINNVLKTQKFPKTAYYDYNRPVETLSSIANHFLKDYFKMKVDSRQYVEPAVKYVQEVFALAQKKGMLSGDHKELSDKLADTINLEIIEPVVRVNRAYRFALKVPKCDRYVICLVNKEPAGDTSLPGLRSLLSKSASFAYSWMLSTHSGTPFWSFYHDIMSGDSCKPQYRKECNDFHAEEEKVRAKYVHTEL